MAKRSPVSLSDVADLGNLARAFHRAATGKRDRPDVARFAAGLDRNLEELRAGILALDLDLGRVTTFRITDPKPRVIDAPCFRERVLHHAIMERVAPVLERAHVDDTFACRPGKGSLAAVQRARAHAHRQPWHGKADMRSFFASIDHDVLRLALVRRLKDRGMLELLGKVIAAHGGATRRGLPIGALTSQHFANLYLAPLDRALLEEMKVSGMVRYMDDVAWWCGSRTESKEVLAAVKSLAWERLRLETHPGLVQRCDRGMSFLGFRVFPHCLLLSRRRKVRFRRARQRWEAAFRLGIIDSVQLQAGWASACAITAHAESVAWMRRDLLIRPAPDA